MDARALLAARMAAQRSGVSGQGVPAVKRLRKRMPRGKAYGLRAKQAAQQFQSE